MCDTNFQYESFAPTASTDRACTALTVCLPGRPFECCIANYTQDRRCQDYTVCLASQYEAFAAATETSDRERASERHP